MTWARADLDINALLDKIAQLAKRTIPGAGEVSVTLLHGGNAHTAAFTGELALKLDEMQYDRGHGPCLDASTATATFSVPDTGSEHRWPDWGRNAQRAGAHSSLSIGLPVHEKVTGALNIYATKPHAFDDAIALAQTFAGFAAVGLANAHLYETQPDTCTSVLMDSARDAGFCSRRGPSGSGRRTRAYSMSVTATPASYWPGWRACAPTAPARAANG